MAGADDDLLDGSILPPRLEDAGLEDCALPPDSIAEAFSLAAAAVSSRLARLPLSDSDDEEDEGDQFVGGCVDDAGLARGVVPDVLVGCSGGNGGADEVVIVGGGGGDKVVTGGREEEEDRVVVVGEGRGEKKLGKEGGCVEGVGEGIDEPGRPQHDGGGDEEEVVVAAEKAVLLPDFD
ncbi:hypothetical protein QOZ80_6AG0532810 [Eleusine coracana subsp. coracana]|nr:hypothetical protein QOZ80_6BG0486340 [Eleusine coracana subsp. coracana]KAK3133134.1 hypothetical protein QOZ80_6AG0532810 [Eleusine coracana subsp. coracana]